MNVVHNDTNDEIILGLKLEYNGAHKPQVSRKYIPKLVGI